MIHPTVTKESGTRLVITGKQYKQLVKKPQAVLWNRDGMYGLVPLARVRNQVQYVTDMNKVCDSGDERYLIEFTWGETEEIPVETGQVLERDR